MTWILIAWALSALLLAVVVGRLLRDRAAGADPRRGELDDLDPMDRERP